MSTIIPTLSRELVETLLSADREIAAALPDARIEEWQVGRLFSQADGRSAVARPSLVRDMRDVLREP